MKKANNAKETKNGQNKQQNDTQGYGNSSKSTKNCK